MAADIGKMASARQTLLELALRSQIKDVVSKFNHGDDRIATVSDVADEVEWLIAEYEKESGGTPVAGKIKKAIARYRKEQAYDHKLAGRGDMDTAGDQFLGVVEKYSSDI